MFIIIIVKAVKRTLNPIINALASISFLRPNLSANGAKNIAPIAIPIKPALNINPSVLGPRFKFSAIIGAQYETTRTSIPSKTFIKKQITIEKY